MQFFFIFLVARYPEVRKWVFFWGQCTSRIAHILAITRPLLFLFFSLMRTVHGLVEIPYPDYRCLSLWVMTHHHINVWLGESARAAACLILTLLPLYRDCEWSGYYNYVGLLLLLLGGLKSKGLTNHRNGMWVLKRSMHNINPDYPKTIDTQRYQYYPSLPTQLQKKPYLGLFSHQADCST